MTKVLIIEARFYDHINDALLDGAKHALEQAGAGVEVITVPGAFEVPAALNMSLKHGFDAYVVLGCVIRGETSHYDLVCGESARGVYDLVLAHNLALGNGLITVENEAQALVRARRSEKDKGGDAARAALHMLELKRKLAS